MKTKWTLNFKQFLGVAIYAALLPASILSAPLLGSWALLVGSLVSLPLAPIGFVVFWGSIAKGGIIAFSITWLVNFFQAWLMLVQYAASKKRKNTAAHHVSTP